MDVFLFVGVAMNAEIDIITSAGESVEVVLLLAGLLRTVDGTVGVRYRALKGGLERQLGGIECLLYVLHLRHKHLALTTGGRQTTQHCGRHTDLRPLRKDTVGNMGLAGLINGHVPLQLLLVDGIVDGLVILRTELEDPIDGDAEGLLKVLHELLDIHFLPGIAGNLDLVPGRENFGVRSLEASGDGDRWVWTEGGEITGPSGEVDVAVQELFTPLRLEAKHELAVLDVNQSTDHGRRGCKSRDDATGGNFYGVTGRVLDVVVPRAKIGRDGEEIYVVVQVVILLEFLGSGGLESRRVNLVQIGLELLSFLSTVSTGIFLITFAKVDLIRRRSPFGLLKTNTLNDLLELGTVANIVDAPHRGIHVGRAVQILHKLRDRLRPVNGTRTALGSCPELLTAGLLHLIG